MEIVQSDGQYSLTFMGQSASPVRAGYDPSSPDFVTNSSRRMYERSKVCRHLMNGWKSVESNLTEYMPKYPKEHNDDYNLRRKFMSLRNFFEQSVGTILGKIFAQPPRLKDDVPLVIQTDLEDADLNGNHWTLVAKDLARHAVVEGMAWQFVDWMPVPDDVLGSLTLADERDLNLRPYWFVVPQSQVCGVRYRKEGQRYTLTQIRFVEWNEEDDGEFGSQGYETLYVYEQSRIRMWRRGSNDGSWTVVADRPNTLGRIPAVPYIIDRIGRYEAKPPLENLARMNIEHLQVRSDHRRSLSVCGFPILVTAGVEAKDGESTKIGPLTSIMLEDEKASVKWVEMQGTAIQYGMKELEALERDIRVFGLQFENPQAYATATGRNIDASDAIAPIQLWALTLRDSLEVALQIHADWYRLNASGGSIDINVSFLRNMITIEGLKLLVEALKEGAITPRGFLTRLKEYGILGEDFDVDKDIKEALAIAEEAAKRLAAQEAAAKPIKENDDAPVQQ